MSIATEIVEFKIKDGVSPERFADIVDSLEVNFHSKQPGFIDSELIHDDKSGVWRIIQHWQSLEMLKAASQQMFQQEVTAPFREALDTSTVNMIMLPQIKKWTVPHEAI